MRLNVVILYAGIISPPTFANVSAVLSRASTADASPVTTGLVSSDICFD
jgi:hypothetical protein